MRTSGIKLKITVDMGDVVARIKTKWSKKKVLKLNLYFDSGSYHSFIREDVARRIGASFELGEPVNFRGLGNGGFSASEDIHLWFCFDRVWVPYSLYVVSADILKDDEVLVGHDMMQKYDIKLDMQRKKPIFNKKSLARFNRVL